MKNAVPNDLTHRGRLGFLLKDTVIYGGSAAVSKGFAFITFPVLAQNLSVVEYGQIDFYLVLVGLLTNLFVFGQDSAVARYFYEHEGLRERRQLISQSLVFQLFGLIVIVPLLWVGTPWISRLLVGGEEAGVLFRIMLLQLPFMLMINFSQNILKWTFARVHFLVMSLGFTVVQTALLVLAVVVFGAGVREVMIVGLCANILFGVLGLLFVWRWLVRPCGFRLLREMLPFAAPFGAICVVGAFSPALERLFADRLLGAESLGIYSVGTKMALLVGLVVGAFQTAWGPFSLSLYKRADAIHTYNVVLKLFVLGVCVLCLVLALISGPLIHMLASERYACASALVFPLAMGLAVQATSWITEIGISISKRSHLSLYGYGASLGMTMVAIMLLVPCLGILGLALAVLVGQITRAVIASWLAQRVYPLPWAYRPVVLILGMCILVGVSGSIVGHLFPPRFSAWIYSMGIILAGGVSWVLLFSAGDRNGIAALLSRGSRTANE